MRILIIEDHEAEATALCKLLTKRLLCPVECSFAGTLEAGLKMAVEINPDITILDPGLPDCTYEEAAKAIPFMPPPVIVVTDFDDDATATFERFCYSQSAASYLSKTQLRETIVAEEGAALALAITRAHWRNSLPTPEIKKRHEAILEQRKLAHVS